MKNYCSAFLLLFVIVTQVNGSEKPFLITSTDQDTTQVKGETPASSEANKSKESKKKVAAAEKKLGLHSDGGVWKFYPARKVDKKLPYVLLIGDSIMNGYRGKVGQHLKGKANVDCWLTPVHLKSESLHADIRQVAAYRHYDIIHFNIGLHGWPKGRITTEEYPKLLKSYVAILKKQSPNAKLIWGSTTPVHERGKQTLNAEINPTIVRRNKIADEVMKEENVSVNDLYSLTAAKLHLVRGDRFHWKRQAYNIMATQVSTDINKALQPKKKE